MLSPHKPLPRYPKASPNQVWGPGSHGYIRSTCFLFIQRPWTTTCQRNLKCYWENIVRTLTWGYGFSFDKVVGLYPENGPLSIIFYDFWIHSGEGPSFSIILQWPHVLRALKNLPFYIPEKPSQPQRAGAPEFFLHLKQSFSIPFRSGWQHFCQLSSPKHGFLCIWFWVASYTNNHIHDFLLRYALLSWLHYGHFGSIGLQWAQALIILGPLWQAEELYEVSP